MQASSTPTPPRKRRKLTQENDELLHKWIDVILKEPTKPSLHERKEILEKVQKSDPWYQLVNLNSRIHQYWDRFHPPRTAGAIRENATEQPSDDRDSSRSNFTVDATKAIRTLLGERPDASDEDIGAWAKGLGIEDDVAKECVMRLRGENWTANGSSSGSSIGTKRVDSEPPRGLDALDNAVILPLTPIREPGSPQSEVSTVVPKLGDTSPSILSPRSVPDTSTSKVTFPLTGYHQPEPSQESLLVSYPPVVKSPPEDATGPTIPDNDNVPIGTPFAHPSPSASGRVEHSNNVSRRSASPLPRSLPQAELDNTVETPLAHNVGVDDNPCQRKGSPPPAMSATGAADFALVDKFEFSAPACDVAPDENVPHLPSFSESSGMQDNAVAPTTSKDYNSHFKPLRDTMDSLILRIRSARQAQTRRTDGPST